MITVRTAAVIDAPEAAVIRALADGSTWRRAIRAVGGRAEAPRRTLNSGDTMVISGRAGLGGRWTVRIGDDGLPVLRSAGRGPGGRSSARRGRSSVSLHTTATGAGTLTRIDWVRPGNSLTGAPTRQRLIAGCQLLLGIVTLVAREPQVVVAGAVIADGTVLAARKATGPEAGQWELAGGKVGSGESDRAALVRELREELGIEATVGERLAADVDLGDGRVLRAFRVTAAAEPVPTEHDELRRLRADELDGVDWLPADRALLPALRALLSEPTGTQS